MRRLPFALALCATTLFLFFTFQTDPVPRAPARELSRSEYDIARDTYLTIQKTAGSRTALDTLRSDINKNDPLARSCHSIAHEIGQRAFIRDPDFGRAMAVQSDVCNSGYMHGLIEMYFVEHGNATSTMQAACAAYSGGDYLSWECYHGVGHGLMFASSNDLPHAVVQCDAYNNEFAATACRNGAFMENFNTDPTAHPTEYVSSTDLFYPCSLFDQRIAGDCYLYAPVRYLSVHENDYTGALTWCGSAPERFKDLCVRGVGTEAMKRNISDPSFTEDICSNGDVSEQWACIRGMAGLYLNHVGSMASARAMCGTLQLVDQPACHYELDQDAPLFDH